MRRPLARDGYRTKIAVGCKWAVLSAPRSAAASRLMGAWFDGESPGGHSVATRVLGDRCDRMDPGVKLALFGAIGATGFVRARRR
jgi:hypothetical protein